MCDKISFSIFFSFYSSLFSSFLVSSPGFFSMYLIQLTLINNCLLMLIKLQLFFL